MKKLFPILVSLVFVTLLAACTPEPPKEEVEVVSPTGCLNSKGRYYDPKLKECITVDNFHQAFTLNAYRYVNKLAEEGKLQEAEYYIHFKNYVRMDKAEALWSWLRERGAKISVLSATMPDDTAYDKGFPPNPKALKIWSDNGEGCAWHHRDEAPADTVQGMILEGIKSREKERPRPELRKAVFEWDDCRVYDMLVSASPQVMREFWDSHLDDIRGIQPYVNDLDKIQHSRNFGPIPPLKEGE